VSNKPVQARWCVRRARHPALGRSCHSAWEAGLGRRTRTGHPGPSGCVRPLLAHFCVFFGLVKFHGASVSVRREGRDLWGRQACRSRSTRASALAWRLWKRAGLRRLHCRRVQGFRRSRGPASLRGLLGGFCVMSRRAVDVLIPPTPQQAPELVTSNLKDTEQAFFDA
jgi:hypothetical protein